MRRQVAVTHYYRQNSNYSETIYRIATNSIWLSDPHSCHWLIAVVNRWNALKTFNVRCKKENAPSPLEVRGRQVNFSFYDGSVTQPTPQLCRTDSNSCHCLVATVNRWNAIASNDATFRAINASIDVSWGAGLCNANSGWCHLSPGIFFCQLGYRCDRVL